MKRPIKSCENKLNVPRLNRYIKWPHKHNDVQVALIIRGLVVCGFNYSRTRKQRETADYKRMSESESKMTDLVFEGRYFLGTYPLRILKDTWIQEKQYKGWVSITTPGVESYISRCMRPAGNRTLWRCRTKSKMNFSKSTLTTLNLVSFFWGIWDSNENRIKPITRPP